MRNIIIAGFCLMAWISAGWTGEVALDDIVPKYMGDGLETAIIPTPKSTKLKDTAVELSKTPVCVAPALLVQAADALATNGLLKKRLELEQKTFTKRHLQRRAWTGFRKQWTRANAKFAKPGWPSPFGTIMEIRDLFPGIQFVTKMPANPEGPVLVLIAQGVNENVVKDLPDLPDVKDKLAAEERYALRVTNAGVPMMISYGQTPWGMLWGVQTLRQMVFAKDGKRYVRLGLVQDYPTLVFRGGKRCKDWWVRYKGNGQFERWAFEFPMRKIPRSHSHVPSAKAKHVKMHRERLRAAVKDGAQFFLLDFNDGRFKTSESEDEPFPGDPAKTVKYLLQEMYKERDALNSDIRIGYMGVAYSINRGTDKEGALLREVNALDGVGFVMMNGLEVFCGKFPEKGAAAYRETLGTKSKLMMYDCQGCVRLMCTPDYQDQEFYKHLLGISAQKSSPIFFIGLADLTWSPETYDKDRALKLACRELADRRPEYYKPLYDHVRFFVKNDYIAKFLPREQMLKQHKANTDGMLARLAKLEPVLTNGKMAQLTELRGDVTGPVRQRASAWEMTHEHGFKDYHVGKAVGLKVDGKVDEAAWKKAPVMETFFPPKGIKKLSTTPLPEGDRSIKARALYDDKALYVSYEVTGADAATMTYLKEVLTAGEKAPAGKVAPAFEMFIKTDLSQHLRWQLMHLVPGVCRSFVLHYFDPAKPMAGNQWEHASTVLGAVTGDNSYTVEVRIPYWQEIRAPQKGDVWGVQLQLNRVLGGRKTPYWLYHWSYAYDKTELWAYEYQYGRWIFQ